MNGGPQAGSWSLSTLPLFVASLCSHVRPTMFIAWTGRLWRTGCRTIRRFCRRIFRTLEANQIQSNTLVECRSASDPLRITTLDCPWASKAHQRRQMGAPLSIGTARNKCPLGVNLWKEARWDGLRWPAPQLARITFSPLHVSTATQLNRNSGDFRSDKPGTIVRTRICRAIVRIQKI